MQEAAVSMRHISKSFGKKVIANKNVDLDIYKLIPKSRTEV